MKRICEMGRYSGDCQTVGRLNRNITSGDVQETVLVQEAMQEGKEIAEIAQMIASRPEIRFVLIAGPSSSGKTTFPQTVCTASCKWNASSSDRGKIITLKEREETPKD